MNTHDDCKRLIARLCERADRWQMRAIIAEQHLREALGDE